MDRSDRETRLRPLLPGLAVTVALVATVLCACWLLLLLVKGLVVVACYALGMSLLVVPLLLLRPIVGDRTGRSRWGRIAVLVGASLLGVVACLTAHLISEHGWLLVVGPAVVVAGWRLKRAARGHRRPAAS